MSRSNALRIVDVRNAFRLIGDCRDAGDCPSSWQEVAMAGLSRLVGATLVAGGEGRGFAATGLLEPVSVHGVGFDASTRRHLSAYMDEYGVNADPIFQRLYSSGPRTATRRRVELVPNREWYRSRTFNDYLRPCGSDHQLTSLYTWGPTGEMSCLAMTRALGERDFSDRESALVAFFHVELGRLIGRSLPSVMQDSAPALSPRLRDTLQYLLEGDSEKQVALRMSISPTTVHQYVTMLYRRFGVRSRAELMSQVLQRQRRSSRIQQ